MTTEIEAGLMHFGNGQVIDSRFEIISNPVKRSFGVAYLAYDQQAQVKRILLFVPQSICADTEAMADISDQAASIRRLNHPHIARLYELHHSPKHTYFELEYVPGKNLRQKKVTAEGKILSENIVKWLGIQVLDALEYAHNNNVIHRDLKPQNVVLTADGKVKLIDFGISETLRASTSLVWDTVPQTTVLYMSPEQLRGRQIAIPSDIYSLAATMYDLLSGRPPFFSGDVYHQILEEPVLPIERISKELNAILQKALAKDPTDRYAQCAEMRTALVRLQPKVEPRPQQPKLEANSAYVDTAEADIAPAKKQKQPVFRFFSLNPTLKYTTASIVVIFLAVLLATRLPSFINRFTTTQSETAVQDTFKLKLARALRSEADAKYAQHLLVSPPGNNALELYRQALKADPGDTHSQARIDTIRQSYISQTQTALQNQQYKAALNIVYSALPYFPQDSLLLQLKSDSRLVPLTRVRLTILNGVGVKGLARRLAAYLRPYGIETVETENYRMNGRVNWRLAKSRLEGTIPAAEKVQELENIVGLPYKWTETGQSVTGNVVLILGADYQNLPAFSQ